MQELLLGSIVPGDAVLYGYEAVLAEYVTAFTGHGEVAAMRYLKQILAARRATPAPESCRH